MDIEFIPVLPDLAAGPDGAAQPDREVDPEPEPEGEQLPRQPSAAARKRMRSRKRSSAAAAGRQQRAAEAANGDTSHRVERHVLKVSIRLARRCQSLFVTAGGEVKMLFVFGVLRVAAYIVHSVH